LQPGAGFALVDAILRLNDMVDGHRPAEVVVMSRNSPATSYRLFNSIEHHKLDIQRAVLTGGSALDKYLKAFSVDCFR
jgi:5'-nucleotidase